MTILNNEEFGKQVLVISCNTLKQGFKALASFVKNKYENYKREKSQVKNAVKIEKERMKLYEPYKGKQTVRQLMQHNQQLNSVDISTNVSLRTFNGIAKKHGVDFAVKKNPENNKYLIFFKAKDQDAITRILDDYAAKQIKKSSVEKTSVREKLKKFKEIVAAIPKKVAEKKKERSR